MLEYKHKHKHKHNTVYYLLDSYLPSTYLFQ